MSWRDAAACRGATTLFYQAIWPEPGGAHNPDALAHARAICADCPVRRECAVATLLAEEVEAIEDRDGLAAFMTPGQRISLQRRGTLRCECGQVRDPIDLVAGVLSCPSCRTRAEVPPIPDQGDRWAKRHTTLARKVVAWLIDNTAEAGDSIPGPSKLSGELGATLHDMIRVYEGLTADGTLRRESRPGGNRYYRTGVLGAADSWYCPYLTT